VLSLNVGLSVAEPKYNFPAALATVLRPADEVPVGSAADDVGVPDPCDMEMSINSQEGYWQLTNLDAL
jgi:hypothetical protein